MFSQLSYHFLRMADAISSVGAILHPGGCTLTATHQDVQSQSAYATSTAVQFDPSNRWPIVPKSTVQTDKRPHYHLKTVSPHAPPETKVVTPYSRASAVSGFDYSRSLSPEATSGHHEGRYHSYSTPSATHHRRERKHFVESALTTTTQYRPKDSITYPSALQTILAGRKCYRMSTDRDEVVWPPLLNSALMEGLFLLTPSSVPLIRFATLDRVGALYFEGTSISSWPNPLS